MLRRAAIVLLSTVAVLAGTIPASASAPTVPVPTATAALGDSITRAFHAGCGLLADCPRNSWSTGSSVDSHVTRIEAGSGTDVRADNLAETGAVVADLVGQAAGIAADTGYVTILMGANDACTDTVGQMTSVDDFRARFAAGLATVHDRAPEAAVYVVSIPDLQRLWEVGSTDGSARFTWWLYDICQSMLEDPRSFDASDVQRRATVRQRVIDFNDAMRAECAAYAGTCLDDADTAFSYPFELGQLSTLDYFHPNVTGQEVLADATWAATYDFGGAEPPTNTAPVADAGTDQVVTADESGTATVMLDGSASTDPDGDALDYAWAAGPASASGMAPEVTLPAGTSEWTLTVTDPSGASDSDVVSITVEPYVEPPSEVEAHVGDLDATAVDARRNRWDATVVVAVHDAADAPVPGVVVEGRWGGGANGGGSCTTGVDGRCAVDEAGIKGNQSSATFTVQSVSGTDVVYAAGANHDPDGDSDGTTIVVARP